MWNFEWQRVHLREQVSYYQLPVTPVLRHAHKPSLRIIQPSGRSGSRMSGQPGPPTPKRRAAHHSPTPPPKSTKMSASAPIFNPSKPIATAGDGGGGGAGPSRGGDDHGDEPAPEEDLSAITAAAVASSRVTRPLPNSRRLAPGADFVPKQATVPKSSDQKENTRRLIVVLSQVSFGSGSLAP